MKKLAKGKKSIFSYILLEYLFKCILFISVIVVGRENKWISEKVKSLKKMDEHCDCSQPHVLSIRAHRDEVMSS